MHGEAPLLRRGGSTHAYTVLNPSRVCDWIVVKEKKKRKKEEARGRGVRRGRKTRPGNGCFYAHAVFHYTDKGGGYIRLFDSFLPP